MSLSASGARERCDSAQAEGTGTRGEEEVRLSTRPWRCGHCDAYDSFELKPSAVIRAPATPQLSMPVLDEDRWKCAICGMEWRVPIPPEGTAA